MVLVYINRLLLHASLWNITKFLTVAYLIKQYRTIDLYRHRKLLFIGTLLYTYINSVKNSNTNLLSHLTSRLYRTMKSMPVVGRMIDNQFRGTILELQDAEHSHKISAHSNRTTILPHYPTDATVLLNDLTVNTIKDPLKISGGVYMPNTLHGIDLKKLKNDTHSRVVACNPMHGDLWPQLQDKETLTVQMCLEMYHNPSGWGTLTGGGTISIFTACMVHRDKFRDRWLPTSHPEIIMSEKTHPAFKKACRILGIKRVVVPVDQVTFKVDVKAMKRAITPDTIMLVANAPAFPEGIIDDIDKVAALAERYGIGCHVDACLGGFLLPFAEDCGHPVPIYDFRLKGVTSISVDLHKYGMSDKGYSVAMFRDFKNYGRYATFKDLGSSMGMYLSQGLEGSRPARVDGWVTMMRCGRDIYIDIFKKMVMMQESIVNGVSQIDDVTVSGDPLLTIIAFRSTTDDLNIMSVAGRMNSKGWALNGLQHPDGFHLCITPAHLMDVDFVDTFVNDLRESVCYVMAHPDEKPSGQLGMYDMMRDKIPKGIKGPVLDDIGEMYLNIITSAEKQYR